MFPCPHCGEPCPDRTHACPHCGSDDETGWHPDADDRSIELPENDRAPGAARGPSNAFAIFLTVTALLGVAALWGAGALASPGAGLGALAVVTVVAAAMRRRR